MLLRAGQGLTSAFVYAEALAEQVIAARLRWRQGQGPWTELTDEIYPYEFSPELKDDAGDFECVFEIENVRQEIQVSQPITLKLGGVEGAPSTPGAGIALAQKAATPPTEDAPALPDLPSEFTDEFLTHLERAANGNEFGLRNDGRFYPYSTPQGRRIGWRQPVWDKALFAAGCSRHEVEEHFRMELARALAELTAALAGRPAPVSFASLDRRQKEALLDFADTDGIVGMRPEFVAAVLANDWDRVVGEHLYVRYAGQAPDHPRNKAFAQRLGIP